MAKGWLCKRESDECTQCTQSFVVLGDGTKISVDEYESASTEQKENFNTKLEMYHYFYQENNPIEEILDM